MNIKKEILKEHSKKQGQKVARYISDDKARFKELMGYFMGNDYRLTQRAACVMNEVLILYPEMIFPYLEKAVLLLDKPVHVAVKRNLLRIMQFIRIPEVLHGRTVESCFKLIYSPEEPLAIKVFSMTVICNLTKIHPELKNELKITVEELMKKDSSPAIQSRGKKTLATLEKIPSLL